jgi:hypothetical protein
MLCFIGGGKMSDKYQCLTCKRTVTVENKSKIPNCCGKPMEKIPREICLQPDHAEHSRPMEEEEPCDDFRSGK